MTNRSDKAHFGLCSIGVEIAVAWVVMFFMLLFAMWTLASHAATFLYIPWRSLNRVSAIASLPAVLLAAWGAWRFSGAYEQEVAKTEFPAGVQRLSSMFLFIATTVLLLATPTYSLRWGLALIGFLLMGWLTKQERSSLRSETENPGAITTFSGRSSAWLLGAFSLVAIAVTLASHRPDLDDSSFIQIAFQTLRHPELPPLTFDASLGFILEPFRFAPYRLASYETFVALLADWSGLNILTIYYLILPGLTAALTIGTAYLFTRWFLPSRLAVLATGIFLLILLAWGESHVAYGNRVFVRLFQGKGLLVALATPLTVVTGLLLLRRPSLSNWIFLALANVAAIGVSANGLVCAFVTTTLVLITTIRCDIRTVVFSSGLMASTLIYPAILGVWLKFIGGSAALPLSQFGSYLPINSSLGLEIREALTLSMLALGFGALGPRNQKREYGLLTGATFLLIFIILNPGLPELLSVLSSRNMSWRLAWATPVPLLLAISFAAVIAPVFGIRSAVKKIPLFGSFLGIATLIFFLIAARWTLAASNNVGWGWPSAKLPTEYKSAQKISKEIDKLPSHGTVLASREIGAWLPVVAPGLELVMPGHTYPKMMETVLSTREFNDRMQLFNAINGQKVDLASTLELMKHYNVGTLIIPRGSAAEKLMDVMLSRTDITVKEIPAVEGHRIFVLTLSHSGKH